MILPIVIVVVPVMPLTIEVNNPVEVANDKMLLVTAVVVAATPLTVLVIMLPLVVAILVVAPEEGILVVDITPLIFVVKI